MFTIFDNDISITRGDNATLHVTMTTLDGEPYQLTQEDTLVLTVKKKTKDVTALIHLVADENGTFSIEPDDTNFLKFGSYKYDIQLTTSDGKIYTIIPPSIFKVSEEVTW